jgi:hypothetical protein
MMAPRRTQISLDPELQSQARRRAGELGISFARYIRDLVARDLARPRSSADPSLIFDLGASGGVDVARDKDRLVRAAVVAGRSKPRRRR